MIKLYFIERVEKGTKKRVIGNYKTPQECNQAINDYTIDNALCNVERYRRYWFEDMELMVDYGSHWKFFKMKPTCEKSADELQNWVCGDE